MILDEFIEIRWHSTNKKYFIECGYVFTKIGDVLEIKISDLKTCSHVKIHVMCDICGTKKYLSYRTYNKNLKSGGYYGCSNVCSMNKYENTNLEKYGNKSPSKTKMVRDKILKTNIEKYGIRCTLLLKDVILKGRETTLKKYGVEHNSQSLTIKEKKKQNDLMKYGLCSFFKTKEFKNKAKITNMNKYGVENPAQSDVVKNKMKKTNLIRYGVEYASQSELIKDKFKKTCIRKYGFDNPTKNKNIAEKAINTMIEKYGESWVKCTPTYNANSIIYLDMISEKLGIRVQHALNGGEKHMNRYYIDGYIEEYNICIEWDEKYHKIKKFKEKDAIRDLFLKENFDCDIIRIKENEFLMDVDGQINIIYNKIIDRIKKKHGKQENLD